MKEGLHTYKPISEETLSWVEQENLNIIPLIYRDKKPSEEWKKWQTQKITPEEIKKYFRDAEQPHNVGVVCGNISDHLFVIDCDTNQIFEELFPGEEKKKGLCYTKTGRGAHIYFKANEDLRPLKCFDKQGAEIVTLKSTGGYVVGPPSIHPNGKQYMFPNGFMPIPRLGGNPREDFKRRALKAGLNFGSGNGNTETIDIEYLLTGVKRGGQDNAILMISTYLRRQGAALEYALTILNKWRLLCTPIIHESEITTKVGNHFNGCEYSYYFKTDPAKMHIKEDLTLENNNAKKKLGIKDIWYVDDNGRRKLNWEILLQYLSERRIYKTISETNELLVYENGIYVPGLNTLKMDMEEALGSYADIRQRLEAAEHLRIRSFTALEEFNNSATLLPLENGLLNLETFKLEEFDPEKLFTHRIPVSYDEDAGYEDIDTFFEEVLHHDDIATMQEIFGYCLWGDYRANHIFWWLGPKQNGKTTTSNILRELVSSENISGIGLNQLNGGERFAKQRLYNKMINLVPEPDTSRAMETPLLKSLTGGDLQEAEKKGSNNPIRFVNTAKFIVYANEVPEIVDASGAFFERVIALEFPNSFLGKDAKKSHYKEVVKAGGVSGLLNWALVGLKRLKSNDFNFTETETTKKMKARMRRESQLIPSFIEEWFDRGNGHDILKDDFFDLLGIYCDLYQLKAPDEVATLRILNADRKISSFRQMLDGSRARGFRGLSLKKTIKVIIPRTDGEKSANEKIVGGELSIDDFKLVPLSEFIDYPPYPDYPGFSHSLYMGEIMLISANKEIIPLYVRELRKVGYTEQAGQIKKKVSPQPSAEEAELFPGCVSKKDKTAAINAAEVI